MKKLNQFRTFDWNAFAKGKTFACMGVKYSEQKKLVIADIVIINDETDYGDPTTTNRFERFKITIPNSSDTNQYVHLVNQQVEIGTVEKASVYGEYSNQLSLVATLNLVE